MKDNKIIESISARGQGEIYLGVVGAVRTGKSTFIKKFIENLIVPYCSVEEQKAVISEIEARMTICDNIEKTVDIALQQAEAMRQSILKKAFEGEL